MTDETKPTPAMKSKEKIISDCIEGFYPVRDENGQNTPAYSHNYVLEAMEAYATQQTAELQQEVERLKEAIIDAKSLADEHKYPEMYWILSKALNPQQDENGR
jgi:hypothetical protein